MNYKNAIKKLLIYCWDNKKLEEFEFVFEKILPEDFIKVANEINYYHLHPEKVLEKLHLILKNVNSKIDISAEVKRRNKNLREEYILEKIKNVI